MQKFTDFMREESLVNKQRNKDKQVETFETMSRDKLSEYGVSSPLDLNDEQRNEYFDFLKTNSVYESFDDIDLIDLKLVNEAKSKVNDEQTFRDYADLALKSKFKHRYNKIKSKKIIDDIVKKVKQNRDDWSSAIGELSSMFDKK